MMSPLEELRHSASHILATAVLRLFPDAKLDIGPPTELARPTPSAVPE